MGYQTVRTMMAHLDGQTVPSRVVTGQYLATRENLESDEMRPLLYPERFSGQTFQPEHTKYTIGVIPKGLTHEFWQSVRVGAEKAAKEAGNIKIEFNAPLSEQDVEGQIKLVREFVAAGADGICLSPINAKQLISVAIEAKSKYVPTLIFDSDLYDDDLNKEGEAKVSYFAIDNFEAGALAARRLAEVVDSK